MATDLEEGAWRNIRAEPRLGFAFHLKCVAEQPDGALLLEGEVATLAHKKLALRRAASAPGVSSIVDRLRVAAPVVSDRQIRARLRTLLAQDRDFSDLEVREDTAAGAISTRYEAVAGAVHAAHGSVGIEVELGVVTLNGHVPTLVRKRLAGALAWTIPGVRDVVNGLQVQPDEDDGPDQIEEAVRVVLDRDRSVDAAQIKVGVRQDIVRLSGLASSGEQRARVEARAWSVFGVGEVINEIEVRR